MEVNCTLPYIDCIILYSGFFPKVLIFPIFPNKLLAQEILFSTADCFKRVYCVITNSSVVSNTYVASYS